MIVSENDHDFVIMPFNDYEKIVNGQDDIKELSEKELWDKVDRDIALWKSEHTDEYSDDARMSSDDFDFDLDPIPSFDPFDDGPIVKPFVDEDEDDEDDFGFEDPFKNELEAEDEDNNWENPFKENKEPFLVKDEIDADNSNYNSNNSNIKEHEKDFFERDEDEDEEELENEKTWSDAEIKTKSVGEALEFLEENYPESLKQEDASLTEASSPKDGKNKFAIPENRAEGHVEDFENEEIDEDKNENEPIKYENIPPPPNVKVEDLLKGKVEKESIIDTSFEDDDFGDEEEF